MSFKNANGERIEVMTDTDTKILEIERKIAKIETLNRQLLDTNESLVKNVKYLMELNKPETKRNEG